MSCMMSRTRSPVASERVRTVPCRKAVSGMMLYPVPDSNLVTLTTARSPGSILRETMVFHWATRWLAARMGSAHWWGTEAWPPWPLMVAENMSGRAMRGPGRVPNQPVGLPGQTCRPKTSRTPSRHPASTMNLAPPGWFSSLGWNRKRTPEGRLSRCRESRAAAPKSMAVCASWPHMWDCPEISEAKSSPDSSWMGRASMSARRAMWPLPSGPGRSATMPPPTSGRTSRPSFSSSRRTRARVRGSSAPISGWRCSSRRMART